MSNTTLICSVLLFFSFLSSFASSSYLNTNLTTHKCSAQQTLALLHFKQNSSSINVTSPYCQYSYPVMMNWDRNTDCCGWGGVTCDHSTGDVIGLDLSCGMLQGTLHPNTSLFNLVNLQSLNLAFNNFTGSQLPREIRRLSNSLTHLNISYSGFSGKVPTDISLLHKLVSLDLSWNFDFRLEPRVFSNLLHNHTCLEELSLGGVNISSVLPLNISSSLRLLGLSETQLQGKIRHTIFNLQSLEKLDLSFNSLTGQIPWEISLHPKLVSLDLSMNKNLGIKPYIFNNLLQNSTLLRDLSLSYVNLGLVLPTYLNISSSLNYLDLGSTSLRGKLPDNIFNLQYLEELYLSFNTDLTGPLPRVNATNALKILSLSGCSLTGSLPSSIVNLRHLTVLDLHSNKLNGTLPSSLFSLRSLETLDLRNNQFDGQIDVLNDQGPILQTFQQLTNLTDLDLSYNNFSGDWELDTLLSSLPNLYDLTLSYSGLSVTNRNANPHVNPDLRYLELASCKLKVFPESLRSMRNIYRLDLSSNEIHGQIPQWAGEIGGNTLYHLNLSHNFITALPQSQWYTLEYMYLQSNLIQGRFPPSICNMNRLWYLDMSNNSFDGVIPECLGNITSSLKTLYLSNNRFRGPFPPSICNMNRLWYLDLSNNSFDGAIPECFGNITSSLSVIDLGTNRFQGTIPNVYENCGYLQGLILKGNQFDGEVPYSLSKCQSLRVLDMGNNKLNGTFPHWLRSLPHLQILILKSNNFHGPIVPPSTPGFPFQSLQVFDLSYNKFVGQLPKRYFRNFSAMKSGIKSNTKLEYLNTGVQHYTISVSMKGTEQAITRIFVGYKIVCLSHNQFNGEIPDNIGKLNLLIVLDLSHNSLTGQIPHAFGKLTQIESLDLSWNQLTGKIPQSLVDLTLLEFLNLSQNNLVGHIPTGKQFNTFTWNSFEGNPNLCCLPLHSNENTREPQLEGGGTGDGNEEDSGFTWRVVMLGYGCGVLFGLVMGYLMLSTGKPMWFNSIVHTGDQMISSWRNKRRYIYIGR
uniref:receptor-like protein 7 n=1 Tax=Erigeron canadensis TaxID=72917 RepID=UPI001CB91A9A|nr:receptor-like protein 7 [Erigeron canadensis]